MKESPDKMPDALRRPHSHPAKAMSRNAAGPDGTRGFRPGRGRALPPPPPPAPAASRPSFDTLASVAPVRSPPSPPPSPVWGASPALLPPSPTPIPCLGCPCFRPAWRDRGVG